MIRAGDWVIVVRPSRCDGSSRDVGRVFRAQAVEYWDNAECLTCGRIHACCTVALETDTRGWPIRRLQRIGPSVAQKVREEKEAA